MIFRKEKKRKIEMDGLGWAGLEDEPYALTILLFFYNSNPLLQSLDHRMRFR